MIEENTVEQVATEIEEVAPIAVPAGMVLNQVKFTFKQRTVKDEVGVEKKLKKQPALTVGLPNFTAGYLAQILSDDTEATLKQRELILDACNQMIKDQARSQFDSIIEDFGDDESRTIAASMLDYDKLSLEYIANLPPSQRGAKAITEEEWNAFFADYLAVLVAKTGKDKVRVGKHVELFKKPQKVKAQLDVMAVLVDQLDIYLAHSTQLEDTGEAAMRVKNKFEKWIKEDAKIDTSAL